ncbi:MAG TPA: hypothetical protein VFL14_10950 [Xanthomonadales bacterium]|nr:hypothetical protein [Xanthomonadales bacterium]
MNGLAEHDPQPISAAERRALEQVYTREPGHISPRALATLVERGLVCDREGRLEVTDAGLRLL